MKKMILLTAVFCCAAFCLINATFAADDEIISYDSGYISNLTTTSSLVGDYFGIAAETVRFTPPKTPWTITALQIVGWNGFDNETVPSDAIIGIEIRDQDLNLLYRFTDSHLPYFTDTRPLIAQIDIPPTKVDGDFYVSFYDRGAVGIAFNATQSEETRSYIYNRVTGNVSAVTVETDEGPISLNWMIRAMGF